jgi:outer membrane protein
MIKKSIIISFILIVCFRSYAQEKALENYIKTGLESNISLQQKLASYEKSMYALKEARSMFFPDIKFNARYTVADGGREIRFPLDTLLGGVYNTLNYLAINDPYLEPMFPTKIEDENIPFLRPKEHETKLSLVQPIFNSDIYFYNKIQKDLMFASQANMQAYKTTLVAEIKTAYFTHLQALELEELLLNTRALLEENIRVNKSLYENDKKTIDNIYRSEAELAKLENEIAKARKFVNTTASYINFLVNKPLTSPINIDETYKANHLQMQLDSLKNIGIENRAEIHMLNFYMQAAEHKAKMAQANQLPYLVAAVDYGFQGAKYEFNKEQDFVIASLVLKWDLFHGFEKQRKIQQAKVEQLQAQLTMNETHEKIRLQIINAWYDLEEAVKKIKANEKETRSAEAAFRVIEKKYAQGQVNLISYMDARNAMTEARQRNIIANYNYYIKYAALEKAAGLYKFENTNQQTP